MKHFISLRAPSLFRLLPLAACLFATSLQAEVAPSAATTNPAATDGLKQLREREAQVKKIVQNVRNTVVCIIGVGEKAGGTGSGVIINKEGLILTAAHVTEATGKDLIIIFPDGKQLKGKALGANAGTDAGMAQITEKGEWSYAEMGDSNKLKLGDWTMALGHPGGFDKNRRPPLRLGRIWDRDAEGAIFTDCTLIGGDSGGPLFDLEGRVIGIHSSINASLQYNRHVALDNFKGDWEDMVAEKKWGNLRLAAADRARPKLGLTLDREVQEGGAPVAEIDSDSIPALAGVKKGDVITKFDGVTIPNAWAITRELSDRKIGQKIKVSLKRGEENVEVEWELQGRSEGKRLASKSGDKPKEKPAEPKMEDAPSGPRPYLGASIEQIDGKTKVENTTKDSPADKAGLKSGDIILTCEGKKVANATALADHVKSHKPGDKLGLKVLRDEKEVEIEITLGEKK